MVSLSESGNITIETHFASSPTEEKVLEELRLRSLRDSGCNKDEKFYSMAIRDSGSLDPLHPAEPRAAKPSKPAEADQSCCLSKCIIT
jgi:hypothetical protein